jgi:ABC-2 type transport system ATP-binding protein
VKKSSQKMKELIYSGATLFFVSHNPIIVKEICRRAIWLSKGAMVMDGPAELVMDKYLETIDAKPALPQGSGAKL